MSQRVGRPSYYDIQSSNYSTTLHSFESTSLPSVVWPTRHPFCKDPLPLVSVFVNPRRPLHALPSRSVKKPPAFPARPNAILVSFAVALLTLSGDINWKNYRHWIKKMRNFLSFPIKSYYCLQFKLQTMKKRIPPRRFSILSYLLITLLVPNLFAQRNQSDTFRTQAEVFFNEGNNVKAMEYYQKAFQAA